MRKWIIGGILLSLLFTSTAYAHVTGSFGDFLVGIKDKNTTKKLKKEIKETKKEIEQLTPKVEKMEVVYHNKLDATKPMIQFYTTIGLDTYMNFMLQSDNIVDALANQRIIEKKLQKDLKNLNQLYVSYMSTKLAKESLQGHADLLKMIEQNLQARKRFLAERQDLSPEEMADAMVFIWGAKVANIDEYLQEDSELLNDHMKDFVTQKTSGSPYRLKEKLLNEKSKLTYYFRSDHVYVHYQNDNADVILIGQIFKIGKDTARLQFEAGFLNGVMISQDLLDNLPGFEIEYQKLNAQSKGFYVEQANGAIVIQPVEQAKE
jgi:hypothetical protein